ncbi:uncharacterized protein B0I36DRAFT_98461 [Microdochium trichocladiopsis]|uniref:Uncharacterized protein n=1 Tax=Microdochium trichocladiopsis TaxID=1682393 RepID=A0A9P8YCM0_9PEZI|nr:uncharacterized protein B0I36DRAFT_98461 [Microdochium trichocladiopsis]KAH7036008.1 hypothetical protein B0I36DRAFT_98461 [Microdochium trichocladiopsis]
MSDSLLACRADLEELLGFVTKYANVGSASGPHVKDAYKTFKYGFRKNELAEIERKLATVNSALILGLQTLNLDLVLGQTAVATTMHEELNQLPRRLDHLETSTSTIDLGTAQTLQQLETLQQSVNDMQSHLPKSLHTGFMTVQEHIERSSLNMIEHVTALSTQLDTLRVVHTDSVTAELRAMRQAALAQAESFTALTTRLESLEPVPNQRESVRRLVERPDMLRDALAGRPRQPYLMSTAFLFSGMPAVGCSCEEYMASSTWSTRVGTSTFSITNTETVQHYPKCRLASSGAKKKRASRLFRAKVTWFNTVVDFALKAAYSQRHGAGGFSISPWLASYSVVDRKKSPAFQVFEVLHDLHFYNREIAIYPETKTTMQLFEDVVELVIRKLRQVYGAHRASPSDVDANGNTVLHIANPPVSFASTNQEF